MEESDSSEQPSFSTERPNRKDFNVTSQKFNALVKEIHRNIATSPRKSTISQKTMHHIIISALNNDLTIATDASVKYGRAAHAFCFATLKKGNVLFLTLSKVPGPHRFMTCYRAEMASIMSAISLIDIILTTAGIYHKQSLYTQIVKLLSRPRPIYI